MKQDCRKECCNPTVFPFNLQYIGRTKHISLKETVCFPLFRESLLCVQRKALETIGKKIQKDSLFIVTHRYVFVLCMCYLLCSQSACLKVYGII